MKHVPIALLVALGFSSPGGPLIASNLHDHGVATGPKGGRLLEMGSEQTPYIELFVNTDGNVELTLLNAESKPITLHEQIVEVTIGSRTNSRRVPMVKSGNVFITTEKLAGSEPFQITIQLKESPDDAAKTTRITIDTHPCAGCKLPEYICKCDHSH